MFSAAKQWVTNMTGIGQGAISPEAFETFWSECTSIHADSPTRFYKEVLTKFQKQDRRDIHSLSDDSTYDPARKVRFVCTSDTHNQTDRYNFQVPDGDVLIHGGDFTQVGCVKEVEHFADWLDTLPHPIKIVIAGNHELSFDPMTASDPNIRERLIGRLHKSCTYLEDNSAVVSGIKIFGSPWQPLFGNWGYNLKRGEECAAKWKEIPDNTDILITHGPPIGHGDRVRNGIRAGCVDLLQEIQLRVKPQYHIFGHIHEDAGVTTDGQTTFINASMCTLRYKPEQYPVVFEMDKISEETILVSAPAEWNLSDPRKK